MDVEKGLELSLRKRFTLIIWLAARIFLKYKALGYKSAFLSKTDYKKHLSDLHTENANAIFQAAIHLKGALIKIVQIISSRVDIFPDEYTSILSQLQDKVPPVKYELIQARIEEEFGRPVEEVFEAFAEEPVASASLGQVHFATLKCGEEVAVKVQYPGIEAIIAQDLRAVRIIAKPLQATFKNIDFYVLIGEVEKVFEEELNYIQEGRNAELFRANFADDPRIYVPEIYWDYTRARVLTLEKVHGVRIFDIDKMRAEGIEPKEVAYLIVESYCTQVLEKGFMHADPHPGNIFAAPGPQVIYVDFGMMKVITKSMREGIRTAALAAVDHDGYRLTQELLKLGFLARGGDIISVEEVIQYFMDKYGNMPSGEIRNLDIKTLSNDLSYALHAYKSVQIPEDYILVGRGVSLLEGIIGKLAPDVNLLQVTGVYIKKFLYKGKKDKATIVKDEIIKTLINLARAPEKIDALITQVSRGKTNFVMEVKDFDKILKEMHSLRKQVAYGLAVIISLGVFAAGVLRHVEGLSWTFLSMSIFWTMLFLRELIKR